MLSTATALVLATRLAWGQAALPQLIRQVPDGAMEGPPIGDVIETPVEPYDPFEPEGLIPRGPYKGRQVDTSVKRTIKVLTDEEAAGYGLPPGERYVANFLHADKWWIAHIPRGGVAEVIVQDEAAPGSLGHGQMRLQMKPDAPVTLVPQLVGSADKPVELFDFAWTAWGTPPKDYTGKISSLDFVKKTITGGLEQFIITYRMISLEQDLRIMRTGGKLNSCRQFKLQLSDAEKNRVLDRAIEFGDSKGMDEMFSLLTRSCVSELFYVIDTVLDDGHRPLHHKIFRHLPIAIPEYLKLRGLIKPGVEIQNMREEFPD